MIKIHNMTREERKALGLKAVEHVKKNFSFNKYHEQWDKIMSGVHEQYGSWKTRKNYQSWYVKDL